MVTPGVTLMDHIATRGQRRVVITTTRRTDRIAITRIMGRRTVTTIRTIDTTTCIIIISRRRRRVTATTVAVRRLAWLPVLQIPVRRVPARTMTTITTADPSITTTETTISVPRRTTIATAPLRTTPSRVLQPSHQAAHRHPRLRRSRVLPQ